MKIIFLMPLCAIIIAAMWLRYGKDRKIIKTIKTEPPGGLDPLEMDYAQIANISDRGIYAMILYWVSKGYLKIEDEGKAPGVRRISGLPEKSPEHQKYLFDRMFSHGETVRLDQLPAEVSDNKQELRDKVEERFKGKNAVLENDSMEPTMVAMLMLVTVVFVIDVCSGVNAVAAFALGFVLFCSLSFLQNGALGFRSKHDRFEVIAGSSGIAITLIIQLLLLRSYGTAAAAVFAISYSICIPCILFMERRVNNELYGEILGFREFIETAEWDKLKVLSEQDPNYGMDILPYAMLFNRGTEWTKKFEYKTIYSTLETMEESAGKNQ